jgi:HEAT repeat protein
MRRVSDKRSEQPSGTIPLVFWLIIMVVMGLSIGMWAPWRQRGDRAGPKPVDELLVALEDPNQRTGAYVRLKEWGADACPQLLKAAQDQGYGAREEAIELLGRLRHVDARPWLLALDEPKLAEARLVALAEFGGEDVLALLRGTLQGDEMPLKFAALRCMGGWGPVSDDVRDEMLPFLAHEAWGLRELGARFMGRQRYAAAVTPLIAQLADEHGAVRNMAGWALMQIGDEEGVKAVEKALESGAVVFNQDR